MKSDGYLIKKTTIAIVNKAIVVIKTLWPQRAISPSMFTLSRYLNMVQPGSGYTSLHLICVQLLGIQPRPGSGLEGEIRWKSAVFGVKRIILSWAPNYLTSSAARDAEANRRAQTV